MSLHLYEDTALRGRLGKNERDIDSASMKLDWERDWATLTSITAWTDQ
ncbi:hypothetical protein Q6D67_18715 [Haliea sp. E1-2-M8]|nr:hypothetical protein [Haliea sp. E1-2-M8]MDO8863729.1 hypothetical protein [Haliea sp. E1-2-M8]